MFRVLPKATYVLGASFHRKATLRDLNIRKEDSVFMMKFEYLFRYHLVQPILAQ